MTPRMGALGRVLMGLLAALVCHAAVAASAQAVGGVAWVSPAPNSTVTGLLREALDSCWLTASGDVQTIDIYVDDGFIQQQQIFPWGCDWNTRAYSDGTHTLRAV